MLGLGAYESSSDEEVGNNLPSVPSKVKGALCCDIGLY